MELDKALAAFKEWGRKMEFREHRGKLTVGGVAATVIAMGAIYNFIPQGMHVVFWSDLGGIASQMEVIIENQDEFKLELARNNLENLKDDKAEVEAHMAAHEHPEIKAMDRARLGDIEERITKTERKIDRLERLIEEREKAKLRELEDAG